MGDIWDQIEAQINKRSEAINGVNNKDINKVEPNQKNDKNETNQKNNKKEPKKSIKSSKKAVDIGPSVDIYITRSGTYINTEKHSHEIIKKIQNYYTLHDKTIMGYFNHTSNWIYKKNKLYIPRFGSLFLEKKFKNVNYINTILPNNLLSNMTYTGKLFNTNQEIIFKAIMDNKFNKDNMEKGKAGLILNLPAGQGKTFLGMYLISIIKCRTLIVTHNSSILDQWVKLLTEYFPNTKIGMYYGKKKVYGDIMVGVINSLIMDEIKLAKFDSMREFYNNFDLVILDECHEYCSASRRRIYEIAQCPYMIGLSATPDERSTDSLDRINHWGIGPILVADKLPGYTSKDVDFQGHVTAIKYSGHPDFIHHITNEKLDMASVPLIIGQICEDRYRLKMIVSLILEQHVNGFNILVLADRRSYLEDIRLELEIAKVEGHMLTDDKEYKQLEAIRLVGGSSNVDFELAKTSKNIILSSYQYFGTGVSIPTLNAIVLVTPRKSKSKQYINRIFRLGSDMSIVRQIIDIVDIKVSLKSMWYNRKKYYDEQGYDIEDRKIAWKEFE